ncbi:MAG: hypothetical protein LBS69_09070 [Prevotellaceae bacterium]|jgi:hypothetical protein|nr:hypothetical protein [Prevotellaceae bacterium]
MGRKKLERPCAEQINSVISSMLVPAHVLEYFAIWNSLFAAETTTGFNGKKVEALPVDEVVKMLKTD